MTPYPTKPQPPIYEVSETSTDEEKPGFWVPPVRDQRRLPIVIYTPPAGIEYMEKEGKWIFGVPVWDQESARKALDNFQQMLRDYLFGPWSSTGMDLEKLFHVAENLNDVMRLIEKK